ncbi:hypothetical protein, partial [Herbiconiux daphne]
ENEVTGWTRSRTGVFSWQTTKQDPNFPHDPTKTIPVDHERHDYFMNVASIPTLSGVDDCYVAVRRLVGGTTKLYIERFRVGLNVDSALVGAPDPANAAAVANGITEWTALDHLEGELVDIVADGVPMPQRRVTGGKITLPRPAWQVNIGLPYHSKIVTLKPEFQTPTGTPQGAHNS